MEDIPNSIRNTMGIVADVALLRLNEDYEKLSVNLGKRMPVLESEISNCREILRYGILVNDETDNKGKIHDLIQTRYAR